MKMKLVPRSLSRRSTANSRSTSGGDSAEVGSSRMMMRAPEKSTRASSISCCRPIDSGPCARADRRRCRARRDARAPRAPCASSRRCRPWSAACRGRRSPRPRGRGRCSKLLMHHADAGVQRVAGRAEAHLLAVELHRAGDIRMHAGDDLHQRRLAGAVLADEAVDLAGAQREIDVAKRLTPPKDFEMPVSSSSGAPSPPAVGRVIRRSSGTCRDAAAGSGSRRRGCVRSGSGLPSTACRRRSPW